MSKRKRAFDLSVSIIALLVLWPVLILIGLLIKFSSKGPAVFRQERIGLHQRPFTILKFRTMEHCNVHDRSRLLVTREGDPRITGVGAVLRRLKLDELPQLLNVVRGDMSLVGPRPKVAQHETLSMCCRPGVTGAATIKFSEEEKWLASIPEESMEGYLVTVLNPEKCRLDVTYMETATLRSDLKILADTLLKLGNRSYPITISHPEDRFSSDSSEILEWYS